MRGGVAFLTEKTCRPPRHGSRAGSATVQRQAKLAHTGMVQAEENTINLPFVFDPEVPAAEYPTVDTGLTHLLRAVFEKDDAWIALYQFDFKNSMLLTVRFCRL